METVSFYHDDPRTDSMDVANVKKMKSNMTLDFDVGQKTVRSIARNKLLLASPDMNLLKLASPELEKMLIQQNGSITTTPTPTQFICPRSVTEEQEAYARGFVDALEELHKTQGLPYTEQTVSDVDDTDSSSGTHYTLLTSRPASTSTSFPARLTADTLNNLPQRSSTPLLVHMKEEPQTVPCMDGTPPMSPINMECQEVIKLARKRARNRVAARKCRTRKLERISRLEDRVDELKAQNVRFSDTASTLRKQVCQLKQQILEHVQSGCQMLGSHADDLL